MIKCCLSAISRRIFVLHLSNLWQVLVSHWACDPVLFWALLKSICGATDVFVHVISITCSYIIQDLENGILRMGTCCFEASAFIQVMWTHTIMRLLLKQQDMYRDVSNLSGPLFQREHFLQESKEEEQVGSQKIGGGGVRFDGLMNCYLLDCSILQ